MGIKKETEDNLGNLLTLKSANRDTFVGDLVVISIFLIPFFNLDVGGSGSQDVRIEGELRGGMRG
jgi:hypothetical protein